MDVTDLVEFFTRAESPSGVQRVVAGVIPGLMAAGFVPVILDRTRGVFVELGRRSSEGLLSAHGENVPELASRALAEAEEAPPIEWGSEDLLLLPGAAWIKFVQ